MDDLQYELTPRLLDALYMEAMVLADEARAYFDRGRRPENLPVNISVAFSCESLKVTTRLMHSIAWLLHQKAVRAGEISAGSGDEILFQLGYAPASDDLQISEFPQEAQALIFASEDLYFRLSRISNALISRAQRFAPPPAQHQMMEQLRQAF